MRYRRAATRRRWAGSFCVQLAAPTCLRRTGSGELGSKTSKTLIGELTRIGWPPPHRWKGSDQNESQSRTPIRVGRHMAYKLLME